MKGGLTVAAALVGAAGLLAVSANGAPPRSPRADLVVAGVSAPTSAEPGQALVVGHVIRNVGRRRARASTTGYYLAQAPYARTAKRQLLATRPSPGLGKHRSARRSVKLVLPAGLQPGSFALVVCADVRRSVAESRERNNCRSSRPLQLAPVRGPRAAAPTMPALTGYPADPTNSQHGRFTFGSPEADARYLCQLDGRAFQACASPAEYGSLGEGLHTFAVKAVNAGGESAPSSYTWRVDLTPPHVPWFLAVPPDPTTGTAAHIAFASDSQVEFSCRLDAEPFTRCASPWSHVGPLPDGRHTFAVRATDAAGNQTRDSVYAWTIDTGPPPAPVLTITPRNPTNDTGARFGFSETELGGRFVCRLDGGSFMPCGNPQHYAGPLGEGRHSFAVKAIDAAGNEGPTTGFSWSIDTTPPPGPVLLSVPENPHGSAQATFTFSGAGPGVTYRCWLDSQPSAQCHSPHVANVPDGEHTWSLVTADEAGNWSAPARYRWMVDTTPPPAVGFDLGVFVGNVNPTGVAAFAAWLNRPIGRVLEYFGNESWNEIRAPQQIETWRHTSYRMVYSVPLLPKSGATIQEGAKGSYNAYFRELAERLVAAGQANSVLRLGWEMNGFWFPWTAMHDPAAFIAYWRQIVTTMRSVPGGGSLKFDWSIVIGPASMDADDAYPGDAYVDYIGISAFDQDWWPGWEDPVKRWRNFITLPFGLQWQRDFARAHNKQVALDEIALSIRDDGHGGGDNPYYLEQMYHWCNALDRTSDGRPLVGYALYFEVDKDDGIHSLLGGRFPNAAQRFKELFGNAP